MTLAQEIAEFVDEQLYREATDDRAMREEARLGTDLEVYGASVGAVRGTIRNAMRRWPDLTHDDVTATASALWARPVYECRLAVVIWLQSHASVLINTDLTRIEGFLRGTELEALIDPLVRDVVAPLVSSLPGSLRPRADAVVARWAADPTPSLNRAAAVLAG